ncbi:MAG TPA: GAF domain-containing protein [Blastocatellia bacterium]|nr:GAF domain-containing protein [Blastocatellia bacterium]
MQSEIIERYLKDPIVILIIVAVFLFALLVFLFLRYRKNKDARETGIRSELVSMERETQFGQAAEQIQYLKNPEDIVRDIAQLFRDFLSMPVVAVYAGRDDGASLSRLPLQRQTGSLGFQASDLPESIIKSQVQGFWHPQIADADLFAERPGGSDPSGSPPPADADRPKSVVVLPWRGAFGWTGVFLAEPGDLRNPDDLARLSEPVTHLGNRLAVALEIGERERELSRKEERSARSVEFFRSLVSNFDEPSRFSDVARELAKLMGSDSAALWRTEPGTSMIKMVGSYGLRSAEFLPLPVGQGLAGSVAETGEPLALEDAPSDPRCLFPREAHESGILSYLGVPVRMDDATGVVEIHTSAPRTWSESEVLDLQTAASVIGEALKTPDARGNKLRVESSYLGLSEAMQRLRTPAEVLDATVEILGHALGVSRAVVIEFDEQGRSVAPEHEYLGPNVVSAKNAGLPPDLFQRVSEESPEGGPIIVDDSRSRSLLPQDLVSRLQIISELAVPFKVGGRLHGILYLHESDRERKWQPEEVEFADRVARQLALSFSNAQEFEAATRARDAAGEEARKAVETASRAQGVINAIPEAVVGLDREGRLTFFNQTAREWLGLRQEDLGHVVEMMESLAMSDEAIWDTVMASRDPSRVESRTARGQRVSIAVAPVRNAKGEFAGQLVVISNVDHLGGADGEAGARVAELQARVSSLEEELAKAGAASAGAGSGEAELRRDIERLSEDGRRLQKSANQLLEINRLKSEFIVNAGHELESSLQSVLGFAEQLEQGVYGRLTQEQAEAVKGIYAWSRRMKADIDWLIEYGSTRSRRLDAGEKE